MNTLLNNFKLAIKAKGHAREQILHGCTQIENNDLPIEYFEALYKAIINYNADSKNAAETFRGLISKYSTDPIGLLDDDLYEYEKTIILSDKYSLGNCAELSMQAMDYLLSISEDKDVSAETFSIEGKRGDHVFLVIGRDPESNENDIQTWGPNAVICDPWSDKVYPASEYKDNLKSSHREIDYNGPEIKAKANRVNEYDPTIHTLKSELTLAKLQKMRHIPTLIQNYISELNLIEQELNNYRNQLEMRNNHLGKKYGEEDEKYKILSQKISEIDHINSIIKLLKDNVNHIETSVGFRKLHLLLRKNIFRILGNISSLLELPTKENQIISSHRKLGGVISKTLMFCNVHTDTKKVLDEAAKNMGGNLNPKK